MGQRPRRSIVWFILSGILLLTVWSVFTWHSSKTKSRPSGPPATSEIAETTSQRAKEPRPRFRPPPATATDQANLNLAVGNLIIEDIAGRPNIQTAAAMTAGGWVALPKRMCLGGYTWRLSLGNREALTIDEGLLEENDEIGLWYVALEQPIEGPALMPWTDVLPLEWVSLQSPNTRIPITPQGINQQGYFANIQMLTPVTDPGVFVQEDRIVGWTFGDWAPGGFLWIGEEGANLQPRFRVDDFYRTTFANGREEEITKALALIDRSDTERLQALANTFRFDPKLSQAETPPHLQSYRIVETMQSLIAKLVQQGQAREVAAVFDSRILSSTGDVSLLTTVVDATRQGYGYAEAIRLIEDTRNELAIADVNTQSQLAQLHVDLYRQWFDQSIQAGDLNTAWSIANAGSQNLPQDPSIHLLGVRAALAQGDWAEAERLLYAREYPAAFSDEINSLENDLAQLKSEENTVVIRFLAGSSTIPVDAVLNNNVSQNFIVDTGASIVTIPSTAVEELGLIMDNRNPLRQVYTAGGTTQAREIVLDSIEIGGWVTYNVKALVVDIPSQPNIGLLGLNFLNRFRMDLRSDEGVLILEPR